MLPGFLDFLLNIDQNLGPLISHYGIYAYLILFVIIVLETGLVVTPFLPGDSLLFVAGAAAASGLLDIYAIILVFIAAAIIGDTMNYWIGHYFGTKVFLQKFPGLIKKEYIDRTYGYFEKYGGKTIFIARFIPIVRTFAPFLAGVGRMTYRRFIIFNVLGAIAWSIGITVLGYVLGTSALVQAHINILIYLVIAVTLITIGIIVWGLVKGFLHSRAQKTPEQE
ncbi:membrane-associated protein [Methanolinea mesophila]|uniref:VTT domain-containing protein n=1 Tax=Methanolinea mesophila TaxID=547055 RepID=UPI001AE3843F|nr:VTT domain-containing protein [Methanolinea mesophila]MBP1927671.1 membrane-associated protein [Methanolinea mesophila]